MLIIGLTGGIATGKSTVSNFIRTLGIPIIDADVIAREVVLPGTKGYNRVVAQFHRPDSEGGILTPEGTLDRAKLGARIFSDATQRQKLNAILHPLIRRRMAYLALYYYLTAHPMVILDVPLLFESKLDRFTSASVVVYCPESVQLSRLMARDNSNTEAAQSRIDAQMSIELKKSLATHIIDNSGDRQATELQVSALMLKLRPNILYTATRLTLPLLIFGGLCKLGVKYLL